MTTVDRVHLREVTGADVEAFFEQQADPEGIRMAVFPARPREQHFAHWARLLANPGMCARTIECDGRVAGNVGSWEIEGKRLVGYWLGREFWGRGVATRALAAFLAVDPARPLFAHVVEHNAGSRRVLEKCGFRPVGHGPAPGLAGEPPIDEWVYRLDAAPPPEETAP